MADATVALHLVAKDLASPEIQKVKSNIESLTHLAGSMGGVTGALTALTTAAVTMSVALFSATKSLSIQNEELTRVGENVGTSRQNVELLQQSYINFGLSAEEANKSLSMMAKAIGQHNGTLRELGVTSRDSFTALMQMSASFQKSGDAASHMRDSVAVLGKAGREVAGSIKALGGEVERTGMIMDATGGRITDDLSARLAKFDRASDDMRVAWRALWIQAGSVVVDAGTTIMKTMTAIIAIMQETVTAIALLSKLMIETVPKRLLSPNIKEIKDTAAALAEVVVRIKQQWTEIMKTPPRTVRGGGGGGDEGDGSGPMESFIRGTKNVMPSDVPGQFFDTRRVQKFVDVWKDARKAEEEWRKDAEKTSEWSDQETARMIDKMKDMDEEANKKIEKQTAARVRVMEAWQQFTEQALSSAQILDDAIAGVMNGLENGIGMVLDRLFDKTQTVMDALRTMIHALYSELARLLARLIAIAIIKAFISGGAIPSGGSGGGFDQALELRASAGIPKGGASGASITIYANDSESIERSLRSPNGSMRRAFERITAAGAI